MQIVPFALSKKFRLDRCRAPNAVVALVLLLLLPACTFDLFKSRNPDVELRQSLEVPPDLARPGGPEAPVAPQTSSAGAAASPSTAPAVPAATSPVPSSSADRPRIQLERDGALRWLTVRDDPQRVWTFIRDYFVRTEMKLVVDDPARRIMETSWIERPVKFGEGFIAGLFTKLHSSGIKDSYKIRVEPGRDPQTTEVYVAHRLLEEIVTEGGGVQVTQTAWLPRPGDPQMEAEMLAKLMTVLDTGSRPRVAAGVPAATPANGQVEKTKDGLWLMAEDMESAWRRVGLVLDRSGVKIEDRDRSIGIYYVRYQTTGRRKDSTGVFGWLVGDSSSDEKEKVTTDRFQVALKSLERGVSLRVNTVTGEPATSPAGQGLVDLLYQQLR